jgi:hypothetical protein
MTKTQTILFIALAVGAMYAVDWVLTWAIVMVRTQ